MTNVRTTTSLPNSVNHQLDMYSMAAKAAGVSVLALALPANARIVYTPAHVVLHRGDPGLTKLDLNHDGITDFTFSNFWVSGTNGTQPFGHLSVLPAQAENGVEVKMHTAYYFAAALRAGVSVGKNGKFIAGSRILMDFGNSISTAKCLGPWTDVKGRYLGMKFVIKGELHFGWARLNVSCDQHNFKTTAVLTGYAYETIANKPIVTGKTKGRDVMARPITLGGLARGAAITSGRTSMPASEGRFEATTE